MCCLSFYEQSPLNILAVIKNSLTDLVCVCLPLLISIVCNFVSIYISIKKELSIFFYIISYNTLCSYYFLSICHIICRVNCTGLYQDPLLATSLEYPQRIEWSQCLNSLSVCLFFSCLQIFSFSFSSSSSYRTDSSVIGPLPRVSTED